MNRVRVNSVGAVAAGPVVENGAAAREAVKSFAGGKRKAEGSPGATKKNVAKKRSALGDLTNAVKKKSLKALKSSKGGKIKSTKEVVVEKPVQKEEKASNIPRLTRANSKSKSTVTLPQRSVSTSIANININEEDEESNRSGSGTEEPENDEERKVNSFKRKTRSMSKVKQLQRSMSIPPTIDLSVSLEIKEKVKYKQRKSASFRHQKGGQDGDSSLYTTAIASPTNSTKLDTSDASDETDVICLNEINNAKTIAIKARLPDGVIDFDEEVGNDPYQVPEYVQEIFDYYKRRELRFPVKKYLDFQSETNKNMRAILIDWMVEVQESFELNHETLYLAVKMLDVFLGIEFVKRDRLQLIGTTALYVASKYDERCPPAIDDFCYICDDAYPQREVIKTEILILKTLKFDIGFPLSYRFLRRFARCAKIEMELLTLARYILELSLMEYDLIDTRDSMLGAAALLLALKIKKFENPWTPTLQYYSGYGQDELFDLTHRLYQMVRNLPSHLKTIRNKYSHKVFFEVAKIPLPAELKF